MEVCQNRHWIITSLDGALSESNWNEIIEVYISDTCFTIKTWTFIQEGATELTGAWPASVDTVEPYTYNVDNVTAPFSVRYAFSGALNTANPQMSEHGGALTYGEDFYVSPNFYKCFFKGSVENSI